MNLSGSLDAFGIDEVLSLLGMSGRTARMQVTSAAGVGAIQLVDGQVSAASADCARAGLLRRVVAAAPVPVADLSRALEEGDPVRALVDSGAVDRALAQGVAVEHCVDALGDLLTWTDGEFAVWVGAEDAGDIGVRLPVSEAVARGRARLEEWDRVRSALPAAESVLALAPAVSEPTSLAVEDWDLLARVDGRRTLAEVLAAVGCAPLAASGRIVDLMGRGLVRVRSIDGGAGPDEIAEMLDVHDTVAGSVVVGAAVADAVVADAVVADAVVADAVVADAVVADAVVADAAVADHGSVVDAPSAEVTEQGVDSDLEEDEPVLVLAAPVAVREFESMLVPEEDEPAVDAEPVLVADEPVLVAAEPVLVADEPVPVEEPVTWSVEEPATWTEQAEPVTWTEAVEPDQAPEMADPVVWDEPVQVAPEEDRTSQTADGASAPVAEPVAAAVQWSPWAQALGLGVPAPAGELVHDPLAGPGIAELIADAHGLLETVEVPVPLAPIAWEPSAESVGEGPFEADPGLVEPAVSPQSVPTPRQPGDQTWAATWAAVDGSASLADNAELGQEVVWSVEEVEAAGPGPVPVAADAVPVAVAPETVPVAVAPETVPVAVAPETVPFVEPEAPVPADSAAQPAAAAGVPGADPLAGGLLSHLIASVRGL